MDYLIALVCRVERREDKLEYQVGRSLLRAASCNVRGCIGKESSSPVSIPPCRHEAKLLIILLALGVEHVERCTHWLPV